MRRVMSVIDMLCLSLFVYANAFAGVSPSDQTEILQTISYLERCVNAGDAQSMRTLFSPAAPMALQNEVEAALGNNPVRFEQHIDRYHRLSPAKIKAKGSFTAEGKTEATTGGETKVIDWQVINLPDYFVFEKVNGQWLIYDMDFHRKVNAGYVSKFAGTLAAIIIAFSILCGIFWIWMLIDCINRPVENKIVWLLVIIFLNLLGALLYFLLARHREAA